jgi:hypothetical protein
MFLGICGIEYWMWRRGLPPFFFEHRGHDWEAFKHKLFFRLWNMILWVAIIGGAVGLSFLVNLPRE